MRLLALDIETESDGLNPATDWRYAKLRGLGYYGIDGTEQGWLTPAECRAFIEAEIHKGTKFAFHYGKYDQKVLHRTLGIFVESYFDTHLAAGILQDRPAKLKLDSIATHYGVAPVSWKETDILEDTSAIDDHTLAEYCMVDCKYTYRLARTLYGKLKDEDSLSFFLDTLMVFANGLTKVELQGIAIDLPELQSQRNRTLAHSQVLLKELETTFKDFIDEYERTLLQEKLSSLKKAPSPAQIEKYKTKFKFNFNSSDQLLWLLKDKLGIECKDRKDKYSTSKEVLEKYSEEHPLLKDILEYRSTVSTVSQYNTLELASLYDNKIHTSFNLDIARTGRLSSSDPNLQNVRRGDARKIFKAEEGYKLVVVDYAQIEPRVVAHLSRDESLINAFKTEKDFYSVIIKGMLNLSKSVEEIKVDPVLRPLGKVIGLAVLYGIGPAKLAFNLSKGSGTRYTYQQAHACIETFYSNFPGLADFRKKVMAYYAKHKKLVNMFGRPLYMEASEVEHKAINAVVQGSASDLNCIANLKNIPNYLRDTQIDATLIHLVHDECIWQVKSEHVAEFLPIVEKGMVSDFDNLRVGLKVEPKVGATWGIK